MEPMLRSRFNLSRPRAARGLAVVVAIGLCAGAHAANPATAPSTAPARAPDWGDAKLGLVVGMTVDEPIRARQDRFDVRIYIKNTGQVAVPLGGADKSFAYVLWVADLDHAWFTSRMRPARQDWPRELGPGKTLPLGTFNLAARKAYDYANRTAILNYYINGRGQPPAGDLPLGDLLTFGQAKARLYVYLAGAGRPVVLSSAGVELTVGPPDFDKLSPGEQKAYTRALVAKFDAGAFSGQRAAIEARQVGPGVAPALIDAVADASRHPHSRMWLTAAICSLRCEASEEALLKLIDDKHAGVRSVVAYHGPRQRSARLDEAIVQRVLARDEGRFAAMASLGFAVFRQEVPPKLLRAGLDSDDPRVRSAMAAMLTKIADTDALRRLVVQLDDRDETVRATAARLLGQMGRAEPEVIAALVGALDREGDLARVRICEALGELTDQEHAYDPTGSAEAKARTVRAWKDWWKRRRR